MLRLLHPPLADKATTLFQMFLLLSLSTIKKAHLSTRPSIHATLSKSLSIYAETLTRFLNDFSTLYRLSFCSNPFSSPPLNLRHANSIEVIKPNKSNFYWKYILIQSTNTLQYVPKLQINLSPSLSNSHVSFYRFLSKRKR